MSGTDIATPYVTGIAALSAAQPRAAGFVRCGSTW